MILDALLKFSDGQAVTGAADSTDVVDLGVAGGRDIGTGEQLYIVVNCEVTVAAAGETITIALQGDTTSTITPDATQTLGVIPANTVAGNVFIFRLDPGAAPLQMRFINIRYTPSNTLSGGTFSAYLTNNIDRTKAYADAVTISA